MKKLFFSLSLVFILTLIIPSAAQADSEHNQPIFSYTHLLPGPYTIPSGMLVYGTTFAYGLADSLQVSTNVVRDIYKIFNASTKLALYDSEFFATALTFGWETYNLRDFSSKNPDLQVNSWIPGAITAFALAPTFAVFLGGNLNFTRGGLTTDGIDKSGLINGATVQSDLSWAYHPPKKRQNTGIGNAISTGVTYDLSYKIYGLGLSHHWPNFQIGMHYYPNANEQKLMPILVGGGTAQF